MLEKIMLDIPNKKNPLSTHYASLLQQWLVLKLKSKRKSI